MLGCGKHATQPTFYLSKYEWDQLDVGWAGFFAHRLPHNRWTSSNLDLSGF